MPAPLTIPTMEPNWIALVLVALGLYLAFKLIGVVFKLLMWLVVLVGAYWFVAPALGWPTVSDLVYVFGPDFEGQRIEEVFTPERIADGVTGRVVDGVVERVRLPEVPKLPGAPELPEFPQLPDAPDLPEPLGGEQRPGGGADEVPAG